MTTHYIDLIVGQDPEVGAAQLFGALYDRLHLTLVRQRISDVGVSFPDYKLMPRSPGSTLRLHSNETSLRQLVANDWLKGMRDHVHMTDIAPAPADALHRTVQRKQFKTNVERLRRRRMKRKGETAEQAQKAIPRTVERTPDLPYVQVRSRSTMQPFCLFIALGPPQPTPVSGTFNHYGLGGPATVPWF